MPVTALEELARGVSRGIIDGIADNSDKLPSIARGLVSGALAAWREFTTNTATSLPADPARLAADLATEAAAIKAGQLPPGNIR